MLTCSLHSSQFLFILCFQCAVFGGDRMHMAKAERESSSSCSNCVPKSVHFTFFFAITASKLNETVKLRQIKDESLSKWRKKKTRRWTTFGRCPSEKIPRSQHKINDFNSLFAVHMCIQMISRNGFWAGCVRLSNKSTTKRTQEEEDTLWIRVQNIMRERSVI